jgi:hypothetical protein
MPTPYQNKETLAIGNKNAYRYIQDGTLLDTASSEEAGDAPIPLPDGDFSEAHYRSAASESRGDESQIVE